MNSQRIIQTNALPPNIVKPLPTGATNIYTAGIIKQNNQNELQNKLTQNGGYTSSTPVIAVAQPPSYAVNSSATNQNFKELTILANNVNNNAAFDKTVNGTQQNVNMIAAKQDSTYYGKGGKHNRNKNRNRTKRSKYFYKQKHKLTNKKFKKTKNKKYRKTNSRKYK